MSYKVIQKWSVAGATAIVTILAVVALAQESGLTGLQSWREGTLVAQETNVRQAVRARIATVRGDHGKLVAGAHRGRWQSERYNRSAQPWFVQLEENHDDGTIAGRLTVVGSGLFSKGKISGKADGNTVSGVITGDSGTQLASFTGSVSPGGAMSGSYTTSDGDVGSWGVDSD